MGDKWLRTTECLAFEVEGAVARITLNRLDKRNALSRTLLRELREALLEADDRKAVRCVVLAGAGKDFCAGYDMAAASPAGAPAEEGYDPALYRRAADGIDDDAWRLERSQADVLTLFDMHKPVVAAVHGHCVAGGTDLALSCDVVVAAENARIGFPAVRSQGTPPMHWWIYNVGPQWAKRLLLTGDLVSGRDAARIGLVLQAVPAARLRGEAEALARRMALIDADVLAANKRVVNTALELMGARTVQCLAAETDARGHLAAAAREFARVARAEGLPRAFRLRDAPFGDGMVRLDREEARDP
jgi:enoyl-CoA hydratase